MSSARETDLDPRTYIGLSFPLRADNNNDFALTKNSLQQAVHNLKNLLLTHPGERVGQPTFGSRLRALCFEPDNTELPQRIEAEVIRSVNQWLGYININSVDVLTDAVNKNKIITRITFSTSLNPETIQQIEVDASTSTDY